MTMEKKGRGQEENSKAGSFPGEIQQQIVTIIKVRFQALDLQCCPACKKPGKSSDGPTKAP